MWSYYGAKTNIVDLYPKPKHDLIIEPFAGSARYALKYFEKDIILIDRYHVITDIWKWLQMCSPNDILSLPRFKQGDNINDHTYNCVEERYLCGFLVGFGFADPRKTATPRLRHRPNAMNYTINKIAGDLHKIKHWTIINGSYNEADAENISATRFIDPPYIVGGQVYKFGNNKIDYIDLGAYCKSRNGQTIVCESSNAKWLPFVPLKTQHVRSGYYAEGIWTNYHTHFDNVQQKLWL